MNRTVIKFRRMIEEATKNGVYAPAKETLSKGLIFLENILHRNFNISEHYEKVHAVRNQFIFHQCNC